jgi:hypothetical protein
MKKYVAPRQCILKRDIAKNTGGRNAIFGDD